MENIGKVCKKKEVNEFQKILNENEILYIGDENLVQNGELLISQELSNFI